MSNPEFSVQDLLIINRNVMLMEGPESSKIRGINTLQDILGGTSSLSQERQGQIMAGFSPLISRYKQAETPESKNLALQEIFQQLGSLRDL